VGELEDREVFHLGGGHTIMVSRSRTMDRRFGVMRSRSNHGTGASAYNRATCSLQFKIMVAWLQFGVFAAYPQLLASSEATHNVTYCRNKHNQMIEILEYLQHYSVAL
jgi:hypothetical protein